VKEAQDHPSALRLAHLPRHPPGSHAPVVAGCPPERVALIVQAFPQDELPTQLLRDFHREPVVRADHGEAEVGGQQDRSEVGQRDLPLPEEEQPSGQLIEDLGKVDRKQKAVADELADEGVLHDVPSHLNEPVPDKPRVGGRGYEEVAVEPPHPLEGLTG